MIRPLFIGLCFVAADVHGYSFIPATQFQANVGVTVELSSMGITYSYRVSNSTSSQQSINSIFVELNKNTVDGIAPSGWDFGITGGADPTQRGNWSSVTVGSDIAPGTARDGLSMTSRFAPTIGPIFLRGNAPLPSYEDGEDIPDGVFPATVYDDAVIIHTLVPSSFTVAGSSVSIALLERLKHQAYDQGWITSAGVVTSLDAKLAAAREALERGQENTAGNQLRAFLNELEAQRGKKVNESAYFLLKTNAAIILSKLRT